MTICCARSHAKTTLQFAILSYRHVHPHFDLHVFYGMIENFVLLNIRNRLISVFIIFVIAEGYENFSITKNSRTTLIQAQCSIIGELDNTCNTAACHIV